MTVSREAATPRAAVKDPSRLRPLIWLFPICAAIAAAFFARDQFEERGPLIAINFPDASGIRNDDTPVLHRGIRIGQVVGVELSKDKNGVVVHIRLKRDQSAFANEGAAFWIVSPEVTEAGFGGLNTLFSGPYIDSRPGKGEPALEFSGLKKPPREDGLSLTLMAPRMKGVRPGAPVSFRGVQVGVVGDVRLSGNSDVVEIELVVWKRYAALVRAHSRFWAISGVEVKGGLLSGIEVKLESVRGIVSGEIAFATPEKDMGGPAEDGARFALEDSPRKEWLAWAPRLHIVPQAMGSDEAESRLPTGRDLMESKLK